MRVNLRGMKESGLFTSVTPGVLHNSGLPAQPLACKLLILELRELGCFEGREPAPRVSVNQLDR